MLETKWCGAYLYLRYPEKPTVEERVCQKTSNVQSKEIKIESCHTPPPEVEEDLHCHVHTKECMEHQRHNLYTRITRPRPQSQWLFCDKHKATIQNSLNSPYLWT